MAKGVLCGEIVVRGVLIEKEKSVRFPRRQKYLIKYKDKDVIIVQHFPILKMKEQTKTTYNRESYIKLLSGFDNVRAIISGHENEEFEIEDENGIKHINVPSLSTAKEYKVISIKKNDDKFSIKSKIISVE